MLTVSDLHKAYGSVRALDGLDLSARPGRLLGFLGPNGSGKTTTMRAIFHLVQLDRGTVSWHGAPVTQDDLLRFGYMPEQRGLYPKMKIGEQLTYFARLHGLGSAEARQAATEWLDLLGLADRIDDRLQALSHGNQQRVQLAASLVHHPDLLVLDEPFNGLDPLGVDAMSTVLHDRAAAGATVVFSSHQLDLVEELCDDVVIIAEGRDRASGTLEEIRSAAQHRRVDVRLAGAAELPLPEGARRLADNREGVLRIEVPADVDPHWLLDEFGRHGTVERFSYTPPSLSEMFRHIVGISLTEAEAAAEADASTEDDR